VDNYAQPSPDVTVQRREPCAKCMVTPGVLFVVCVSIRNHHELVTATSPYPAKAWVNTIPCPCGAGNHRRNPDGTERHGFSRGHLEYMSQFCYSHPDYADQFAAECRQLLLAGAAGTVDDEVPV
jgi:hypothetical protein